MYGLTRKQSKFLDYLRSIKGPEKPSYRQMAIDMGYKSPSAIHRLMQQLKEKGFISAMPGRASSWTIK